MRWRSYRIRLPLSVALVMLAVAAPARAGSVRGPAVRVVREYLHALAAHDARAVCRMFSPQFRRFEANWENLGPDCARRVYVAHFAPAAPGYSVKRIRIVRVTAVQTDRYGNVAVHLLLDYGSGCAFPLIGQPRGCKPRFERHRDIVYLRSEHGRLLIVKPGAIYYNTSASLELLA
jgi:hypothetical protein